MFFKKGLLFITALALLVLVGQASAGPNANAVLSLDLIVDGGAGNQMDDGVTSGMVSGQGTTIAVEVFATGVTTSLNGAVVKFDFDASLLTFVKAENSAFPFTIPDPDGDGTNFAATSPVTLPASGFLARAEFTTAADVTGQEFSIGIESVVLSESPTSSDVIVTTNKIMFNASTTQPPMPMPPDPTPTPPTPTPPTPMPPDTTTTPPTSDGLSLDWIVDGGAGNQMDDGVTSGMVSGQGTTIAVEVFATGVTTSLNGAVVKFDFDASLLTFVKAENSAFPFTIPDPDGDGTNFAATSPVTLPASGFLARAEFTTAADVTGQEFSIGIESVQLNESLTSSDVIMTTSKIRFNVSTTQPPMPMPPAIPGPALDIDSSGNGMKDGNMSSNAEAGSTVVVEVFAGENLSPIGGGSITFSQAIGEVNFAQDTWRIFGELKDGGKKFDFSALNGGLAALNDQGFLGTVSFTVASVPATISIEQLVLIYASGTDTLSVSDVAVAIDPPTLRASATMVEVPYDGSATATVTAVGFAAGSAITFNVDPMDAVETSQNGAVLTLTASGSATVSVTASKGDFTTAAVEIAFEKQDPPYELTADKEMATIPHGGSAVITLTASGFAEGDDIVFAVDPDVVERLAADNTLTLTATSPATVTVTASVGENSTNSVTVTFNPAPPELRADMESPVEIPRDTSVTVTVTAVGFAEGAVIDFVVEIDGSVDTSILEQEPENGVLTLTASGAGSVSVTARASSGEGDSTITTAPLTIEFVPQPPELVASATMVEIPYEGSAMVTVTAVGFAEGANIAFTVDPADAVEMSQEGAVLTLTATSAATVTVNAAVGDRAATPVTIEFTEEVVPTLMADMSILTIPRGGTAVATVTGMNFDEGATITFNVTAEGSAMIEHSSQGATLTITGSGLGSSVVTITATDGDFTTKAISVQFDEQVAVELSSFVGEVVEKRVVLNWATVSQTNNAGFRVLRSTDRETYEVVSELIAGAGTTDQLMDYTFEDADLPAVELVYYVLEQIDIDGTVHRSDPIEVLLGARFLLPTEFASSVYPNPFNPSTTISYDLPVDADVSIVIYDAIGQEIRQLVSEYRAAGRYNVRWDSKDHFGRSVGSGVYIAKIKAGQHTALQKMLLLK